jgi:DNA-binding XRE family transcriptional regulator
MRPDTIRHALKLYLLETMAFAGGPYDNDGMRSSAFPDYAMAVAKAIRQARKALEMTQEEVAHHAALSVRWYARIESGRLNPTLETLHRLAGVFKTTPAKMLAVAEHLDIA